MNKQAKYRDGKLVGRGIEWTDYTSNPIAGCQHDCRWKMPDGKIAICYAENTATNVAQSAYPQGFAHHYWHPEELQAPLNLRDYGAKIFIGSMADVFGVWVPDEQIKAILEMCRRAHWHTFQFLTKNAPRLLKFEFPDNCWIGVSSPPDFMLGKELPDAGKEKMLRRTLEILPQVKAKVRWMSIEPLSWDCAKIFAEYPPLQWVVIGAATDERKKFQPVREHVAALLNVFDAQKVPVFFKGNLSWAPWREYFPGFVPSWYMKQLLEPMS